MTLAEISPESKMYNNNSNECKLTPGKHILKISHWFKINRNTQNSLLRIIEFCKTRISNG